MNEKLSDKWCKCCDDCKNVKRIKGFSSIAECGLTGMTVSLQAKETCKYFEKRKA